MENKNNQTPEIVAIASVLTFIVNNYWGIPVTGEEISSLIQNISGIIIFLSSVWTFFHSRSLIAENQIMSAKIAAMKVPEMAKKTAVEKTKVKKGTRI